MKPIAVFKNSVLICLSLVIVNAPIASAGDSCPSILKAILKDLKHATERVKFTSAGAVVGGATGFAVRGSARVFEQSADELITKRDHAVFKADKIRKSFEMDTNPIARALREQGGLHSDHLEKKLVEATTERAAGLRAFAAGLRRFPWSRALWGGAGIGAFIDLLADPGAANAAWEEFAVVPDRLLALPEAQACEQLKNEPVLRAVRDRIARADLQNRESVGAAVSSRKSKQVVASPQAVSAELATGRAL